MQSQKALINTENKMQTTPETLWNNCLSTIRVQISDKQFNAWFQSITLDSYDKESNTIILRVPSEHVKDYVEEHFGRVLVNVLIENFGQDFSLKYKISRQKGAEQPLKAQPSVPIKPNNEPQPTKHISANEGSTTTQRTNWRNYLDPFYSFDTFVKGDSNAVALSVSLSISEHPLNGRFNPMFLFGPSGCGKTHLINAIGLRIVKLYADKKVLYVSAKDFEIQYTSAQFNNKINDFLHFYQSIDILIVDDIQFWSGKTKTLETFFHVFNHLFRNGKRIILACDRPPAELEAMEERLLTRFSWGVVQELGRPNIQLCIDILNNKIQRDGLELSPEVITLIAEKANGSVRHLEGVLNTLYAFSINKGCEIDVKFTEECIKKLVRVEDKGVTSDEIMEAVCKHFEVATSTISGRSRKKDIVVARQVVMFFMQKHMQMPTTRIGRLVGGRDHSTVLYSCSQIEKRLKTDKQFAKTMTLIENSFVKK